ncbi:MAG TPA: nucleotidyltransferase family protein [Gaiellaceae bacterium]
MQDRAGSFWPSGQQQLLLEAALSKGERGASAWRQLRPSFDLDALEPASYVLLPLLYRQLERLEPEEPLLPRLRGLYRRNWYLNQLLLDRLKPGLEAVREAGVDALVVSSWELPVRYYGDLGLRRVPELQLLVSTESVGSTFAALARAGWSGPAKAPGTFLRSRPYARFEGENGVTCLVYWRLFHEFFDPARGREPEDLWLASSEFSLGGVSARSLGPADELLQICATGARTTSWPTITWIPDAIAVLRAPESAIDWARFIRQGRRLRATLRLLDALAFLSHELAAPVPAQVLEELRGTPVLARERLAHRTAAARWPLLGQAPEILTRFLVLTAEESIPRALAHGPGFLREEWGLDRWTQLPFAALQRGRAGVAGRRVARRADQASRRDLRHPGDEQAKLAQ